MDTRLFRSVLGASFALALLGTLPVLGRPTSPLQTTQCFIEVRKTVATCGTLTVFEDRARNSGRLISIHFMVIKAKHPSNRAIAFNPGGPGASAIEEATAFAGDGTFGFLRERISPISSKQMLR
jgi:hypothetical protein